MRSPPYMVNTYMGQNVCYLWKSFNEFYMHGSVHHESNLRTVQQDATYSVYYISVGSSASCIIPVHTLPFYSFVFAFNIILILNVQAFKAISCIKVPSSPPPRLFMHYSNTSANEDNSFRNHIRYPKSS